MRYGPETLGPPHLVVGWQLPDSVRNVSSGSGPGQRLRPGSEAHADRVPGVKQAGFAILDNRAPGEASVAVWAWRVWLKR
jgi:hypothetical protein